MAVNELFTELALPFLLIYVLVFAILQKSKMFGEKKIQIDAMIALVVGILAVGLPFPRSIIIGVMPWLAVGLAVLLVFFILYGFIHGDMSDMNDKLKLALGIIAGVFTVGVVIYVTGIWKGIFGLFEGATDSNFFINALIVVLIVVAMIVAVIGGGRSSGSSSESK